MPRASSPRSRGTRWRELDRSEKISSGVEGGELGWRHKQRQSLSGDTSSGDGGEFERRHKQRSLSGGTSSGDDGESRSSVDQERSKTLKTIGVD